MLLSIIATYHTQLSHMQLAPRLSCVVMMRLSFSRKTGLQQRVLTVRTNYPSRQSIGLRLPRLPRTEPCTIGVRLALQPSFHTILSSLISVAHTAGLWQCTTMCSRENWLTPTTSIISLASMSQHLPLPIIRYLLPYPSLPHLSPHLSEPPQVIFSHPPVRNHTCLPRAIVFVAEQVVICQPTVPLIQRQPENPSLPLPPTQEASMHLPPRTESTIALTGPMDPTVPSVLIAGTPTHVASAETLPMARVAAKRVDDPRTVITPLDHLRVEELLRKYGILDNWRHIVDGIHNGFNVGIIESPPTTQLFREPFILLAKSFHNRHLHTLRASRRQILARFQPCRARALNWTFSYIPPGLGAKTAFRQISYSSGLVLPSHSFRYPVCKCRNQCRRFSNRLGHFQRYCSPHPHAPRRLCCSDLRHFFGLPYNSRLTLATKCSLHFLERHCLRGPCPYVRPHFKCWRVRICRRHARPHLSQSWLRTHPKVGGRLSRHKAPTPVLDRSRIYSPDSILRCSMEPREASALCRYTAVHWFRLGLGPQACFTTRGQAPQSARLNIVLAAPRSLIYSQRSCQSAWQIGACRLHIPSNPSILALDSCICSQFPFLTRTPSSIRTSSRRLTLDSLSTAAPPKLGSHHRSFPDGHRLVGRREYLLWNRSRYTESLGCLALGNRLQSRPKARFRHRLGRGHSNRARFACHSSPWNLRECHLFGAFGQCGSGSGDEQGPFSQPTNKRSFKARISFAGSKRVSSAHSLRADTHQHLRRLVTWRHQSFPGRFPWSRNSHFNSPTTAFVRQTHPIVVRALFNIAPVSNHHFSSPSILSANPSSLRPHCRASERLFQWRGVNSPPSSTIDNPIIRHIAELANRASLRDTASYGAGLRKFHIFCDVFSIPEHDRLPASFELLHSFALWAVTDPDPNDPLLSAENGSAVTFEPVSVGVARKYLAAVRAWHIAQGWPPPLSDSHHDRINWSLRGLENLNGGRRKPLRPPISLAMLAALKATLILSEPFDACIWAMASCAFFGMMRFGEISVASRFAFNPLKHLTRAHAFFGHDLRGNPYARLDLPSAKTARTGESQSVFLNEQGDLCPLSALHNLASVVPALANDPLFSWRDNKGEIRPMTKIRALERINSILMAWGWGTTFGHSFRIGGASFYLAKKVNPEIVRIAGRWKSLAYETYIRAFEQISSQHMANAASL
ncbi:hypothetical protein EDD22DRAFT_826635 [Suillus occidentalis]|nr:hypothetical protein EDD22DRAFT_826635 [Suillus occidentalis]